MVLGHHLIMTAYGFWLPNDPRGSWSDFVASWELFRLGGKATKVETRRSVAGRPHDRDARLSAKHALKWLAVTWNGKQAVAIARGFKEVAEHWGLRIHACSILPEHVHLVVGRTERDIRQVMNQLKGRASKAMIAAEIHPFQNDRDARRASDVLGTEGVGRVSGFDCRHEPGDRVRRRKSGERGKAGAEMVACGALSLMNAAGVRARPRGPRLNVFISDFRG